jgi:hypothetical protein
VKGAALGMFDDRRVAVAEASDEGDADPRPTEAATAVERLLMEITP